MRVLWQVIVKEFLQLRRDVRMIPIIFVAPVVQITVFGFAVNTDVTRVPMVLVDEDRSARSRDFVSRFLDSGYFELVASADDAEAAERRLVTGDAQLGLVIAPGFGAAIASGRTAAAQVIVDGSDAASANIALGYASAAAQGWAVAVQQRRVQAAAGASPAARAGQVGLEPRVFYNPDLRSRWYYVPAVLAMVLMIMTQLLSAMGVVREKEIGTMEQLIVTPIRPWQLLIGKLAPFAIIGMIQVFLVSGVAVFGFAVPLRGSFLLLLGLSSLFLLSTLGIGLLVSTVVQNQQQAMMTAGLGLIMPMILLSGLIFPIDNMPPAIQLVTYSIPLRYYAEIIRGVFLRGSGLEVLWPQALALLGIGLAIMTVASLRFRKRLD
ncbi:MAG TPA: ABC transporter permease [Vicinamibacteria bacterium]|nr:ABC transporter permease [Vicinamibacteria bacterium]